jgi:hypothetical protein
MKNSAADGDGEFEREKSLEIELVDFGYVPHPLRLQPLLAYSRNQACVAMETN